MLIRVTTIFTFILYNLVYILIRATTYENLD